MVTKATTERLSVLLWWLSVAAVIAFPSCASRSLIDANGANLTGASEVYTLVNLHPDEKRSVLYAVNYQQAGLILLPNGLGAQPRATRHRGELRASLCRRRLPRSGGRESGSSVAAFRLSGR